jgi:SagB-type dehydrogenase family enzyme
VDGRPFVEQVPGVHGARLPGPLPDTAIVASRLAFARPECEYLVVRSPASTHALLLRDPGAATLFAAMASARRVGELAEIAGVSPAVAEDAVALFVAADLASPAGADPAPPGWEFHDLLFHTGSRLGRVTTPMGATSRLEHLPGAPAVVDRSGAPCIPLFVPDLGDAAVRERAFAEVIEERTSVRSFADAPLPLDALAELLYRCLRTRGVRGQGDDEVIDRPYPSAGALYEQEVYVVAHRVGDLARGIYAYDGARHALVPVASDTEDLPHLLDVAVIAMNASAPPPALVVVTARFRRVMRKYEGVAYALVLKNAGALLQTFALVAHAMGLACCPLGGGDSDRFAAATGADYFEESSVAELALGLLAGPTSERSM